jgi:predicted nucleic acid-binding protein
MGYKLFIDSDVIIDFFTDREPFANPASELFELSESGNVHLFISAVSINNVYYILRKFLGHPKAIEVIHDLMQMTEILGTTKHELLNALSSDFSDFEDAVQYSTALLVDSLDAIITRNTKDYRHSRIAVMTPIHFLKMIGQHE